MQLFGNVGGLVVFVVFCVCDVCVRKENTSVDFTGHREESGVRVRQENTQKADRNPQTARSAVRLEELPKVLVPYFRVCGA